jgi:hypothetical protein
MQKYQIVGNNQMVKLAVSGLFLGPHKYYFDRLDYDKSMPVGYVILKKSLTMGECIVLALLDSTSQVLGIAKNCSKQQVIDYK